MGDGPRTNGIKASTDRLNEIGKRLPTWSSELVSRPRSSLYFESSECNVLSTEIFSLIAADKS